LPDAVILAVFLAVAMPMRAQDGADAKDLLTRGAALVDTKPSDAIRLLREALQLNPELPGLHYQLGLAYHAIGDEADAEAEFRAAVDRAPDSAAAHNYLGIALFHRGGAPGAVTEFQAAAKLAPNDPNAHFNLGEALARTGDSVGALDELRAASSLAPADAGLARLLQSVEMALAPGAIKVEVRQVLVPVVVTDRAGRRLTGLRQSDFRIFEDGVEQKISGFGEESSGEPGAPDETPAASGAAPGLKEQSADGQIARPHRTYMVVIDTLHTQPAGLTAAREALVQLFRQEHSSDSQYAVVALGDSAEVVVNITSDPSAVLAAFEGKRFQKMLADSQMGSPAREIDRLRRDLSETRFACDHASSNSVLKAKCAAGIERTSNQTRQIGELEEMLTAGFLRQFGSLVGQLARARDRRTILLVSDGFSLEPGRDAQSLFTAFFPPASHCLVPADVSCPPDAMPRLGRMAGDFEPILKLASSGNITIDAVDSRGLYGAAGFDAASEAASRAVDGPVARAERDTAAARGNTLAEMAAATGGTAYHDGNNLLAAMRRSFVEGRNFYSLAYVSTNANADGKFRAIMVEVKDKNAVVNAKLGYWAVQ
jgi:VWFA-related protein